MGLISKLNVLVIAYGLYLTFASAICPASCLPSSLPLADLARTLGTDYSEVMIVIAVGAFIAHICEAATCVYFCKVRFKMQPLTILLWGINVLIVGIFGENEKILHYCSRNTRLFII